MSAPNLLGTLLQLLGLGLAPLYVGAIQHLKGRLQGRPGPPSMQPYRELRRLWRKSGVAPEQAGVLYRLAPAVVVATAIVGVLLVPIAGHGGASGLGSDALVLVGVLALGRLTIALSAWETENAFSLIGASRDLMFAVFAEATLLLVLLLAGVSAGGSTDLKTLSDVGSSSAVWEHPAHWCAAAAFLLVAMAETGRQPVDNPDTHLELTMVHEGPLLEYAGRELAALQWASATRLWVLSLVAIFVFLPTGGVFSVQVLIAAAELAVLAAGVAITETLVVKMRILRVPFFLAGAGALCLIGLGTTFVGAIA